MISIYILKKRRHLKETIYIKIKKESRKLKVHPDGELIAEN
jgi:hypothetical protein